MNQSSAVEAAGRNRCLAAAGSLEKWGPADSLDGRACSICNRRAVSGAINRHTFVDLIPYAVLYEEPRLCAVFEWQIKLFTTDVIRY